MFKELRFKDYDFRLRTNGTRREIYDVIRNKWVKITPEEWVRQNIIRWLNDELSIPFSRISTEAGISVNRLKKRVDIIVYNETFEPEMVIECKAPTIKLDEKTLMQVSNYNSAIAAPKIMITNGQTYIIIKHQRGSST